MHHCFNYEYLLMGSGELVKNIQRDEEWWIVVSPQHRFSYTTFNGPPTRQHITQPYQFNWWWFPSPITDKLDSAKTLDSSFGLWFKKNNLPITILPEPTIWNVLQFQNQLYSKVFSYVPSKVWPSLYRLCIPCKVFHLFHIPLMKEDVSQHLRFKRIRGNYIT